MRSATDAATRPAMKRRACDSCYKRKIQCDREEPQCNWCKHHDLACTFNRPGRVKKVSGNKKLVAVVATRFKPRDPRPPRLTIWRRRDKNETGLLERIGRLEKLLAEKAARGAASLPAPAPGTSAAAPHPTGDAGIQFISWPLGPQLSTATGLSGKLHFAGRNLGEISTYSGIPLFSSEGQSWIYSRTGKQAVFPPFSGYLWQNQQQVPKDISAPVTSIELPEKKVTEEYLSVFLNSPIQYVFPVVDRVLFRQTVELAYEPCSGALPTEAATAKACVLSFLSVVSLMEGVSETVPIDSEACALKAQYLFPRILLDVSLTGLQVVFMQCMFHLFSGKFQTAAMFHSMACRLLFMLGSHTMVNDLAPEPPAGETETSWRVKCHLRNYFWLCYIFDKDISLRTGQPPAIDDVHCDLNLPRTYQINKLGILLVDGQVQPFLPGDLRISIIKSKAIKLLYSPQALRKSDAELLRDIRELDDELESWRMSIDIKYRPKLWSESCAPISEEIASQNMNSIISNFEYNYLMTTIHQATSRCRAWGNGQSGEMEGVSSSLALAVQASRSTFVYLRAVVKALVGESFWLIIFYPMSAVITIFCNILLYPLNASATQDLELLKNAPELIRGIRSRRLTINEILHMKMIEDFVAELVKLGTCAIQKAREVRRF